MYTIKEASLRSGVGIPLLRAWERRYGVVTPMRTASGYRLYDEEAIARLVAMRGLIDGGWAPQQAADRIRSTDVKDLAVLVPESVAAAEPTVTPDQADPAGAHAALVDRMVSAAARMDVDALGAALDEAFASLRFETAWDAVLRPALRRIGEGWQRGEIDVAGEHVTSQTIHRRLAMAFDAAGTAATGAPVLVGLAPGARHEFGALAFATAARRGGLPVLYLGPDLPVASWVAAARERSAHAAVIGVPRRADVARADEAARALQGERPGMPIVLGGAHADRVDRPGVHHLPDTNLLDAVTQLRRLLPGRARRNGS